MAGVAFSVWCISHQLCQTLCSATEWTWFSNFLEKALVYRVNRLMLIRIVRFGRSTSDGVPLHATESNGLLMDFLVSRATGTAERDAVPVMLDDARQRGYRPRDPGRGQGVRHPGVCQGHA